MRWMLFFAEFVYSIIAKFQQFFLPYFRIFQFATFELLEFFLLS